MNIEKLIQDAILTGAPVRLRDGSKAYATLDYRELRERLGIRQATHYLEVFRICRETGQHQLLEFLVARNGVFGCSRQTSSDVVGPWLEFDRWEALVSEIQYIAMSDNGEWHGFTEEPETYNGAWVTDAPSYPLDAIAGLPQLDTELWEHSLIKRAKGV